MWTIRTFQSRDIDGIVDLINAADAADHTEDGTSVEDTRAWLSVPDFFPEKNVLIAEDESGRIVGYAYLRLFDSGSENSFRTWFQVHPSRRGQGLEALLLKSLYAHAEQRMGECLHATVDFFIAVFDSESWRLPTLNEFGLEEVRRGWTMVRPTLDDVAEAQFPASIRTRPYRVGDDDVACHQTDNEVFRDHWGHTEHPLEEWRHLVAQPFFKPALSILAEDASSGRLSGFCIVTIKEDENRRLNIKRGWIEILGVRREYRRQGLGTALVLAGMHNIRSAAMTQAALGCDSENLTGAVRIYKRLGFKVHKERLIYRRRMRGSIEQPAMLAARQVESQHAHRMGSSS